MHQTAKSHLYSQMIFLVCLNALEAVGQSHWCKVEQEAAQSASPQPQTPLLSGNSKKRQGEKQPLWWLSQKTNKTHSVLVTQESSPFNRSFSCLWIPQTAMRQGRRSANDTQGSLHYSLAGKLPATLKTDTTPSAMPEAPSSHAEAQAAMERLPAETQDWEGSWHILHSHKNLLQFHTQPTRHATAHVSMLLQQLPHYCPQESQSPNGIFLSSRKKKVISS